MMTLFVNYKQFKKNRITNAVRWAHRPGAIALGVYHRARVKNHLSGVLQTLKNDLQNMKKTLVALFALAGVVMAETVTTEFDIVREGNIITFSEIDEAISLSYVGWTYAGGGAHNTGSFIETAQSNYVNTFSPDGQLRANQPGDIITMNFTITNNGAEAITLDKLNIQGYSINGDGANKNGGTTEVTFTMQLFSDGIAISGAPSFELVSHNNVSGGDLTLTDCKVIESGGSVDISLNVSNGDKYNTYFGLTGGSVTYSTTSDPAIPEPAAATLSLLALAGLATRRRRK